MVNAGIIRPICVGVYADHHRNSLPQAAVTLRGPRSEITVFRCQSAKNKSGSEVTFLGFRVSIKGIFLFAPGPKRRTVWLSCDSARVCVIGFGGVQNPLSWSAAAKCKVPSGGIPPNSCCWRGRL